MEKVLKKLTHEEVKKIKEKAKDSKESKDITKKQIEERIKILEKELNEHNQKKQQGIKFVEQETKNIILKAGAIQELQKLIKE